MENSFSREKNVTKGRIQVGKAASLLADRLNMIGSCLLTPALRH